MITTCLNEVNEKLNFEVDGKEFCVNIENNKELVLKIPYTLDKVKGIMEAYSDKIIASMPEVMEFKHYRKNGSKFWTKKLGFCFFIKIKAENIHIIHEKTYSYVSFLINNVKVTVNVSGGTGIDNQIWNDYISNVVFTAVNINKTTLKNIMKVAEPKEENKYVDKIISYCANETQKWIDLYCKKNFHYMWKFL